MLKFKDISVRWKLVVIIMAGSIVMSFLTMTLNWYFEITRHKSALLENYHQHATLLGKMIADPLMRDEKAHINTILDNFSTLEDISSIKVYDKAGMYVTGYFSVYPDSLPSKISAPNLKSIRNNTIHVHEPVMFNAQHSGTICLVAEATQINKFFKVVLRLFILFLVPFLVVIYLIALWMQRYISTPLITLADIARKAAWEKNYEFTIEKKTNDEIGTLYEAFNHLLREVRNNELEMENAAALLQKEKQKAIQSDNLKSSFLSNISHEIRTPMNAIIGYTRLFTRKNLTSEKREKYLTYIHKSSESLIKLIDDIIIISRIESGELIIKKNYFLLDQLLQDLKRSVNIEKEVAGKPNLNVFLSYDPQYQEMAIYSDADRLRQVLLNLLLNAIKFTEKGSVNFGFSIFNAEEIIFFVKDTGTGIDELYGEDVFERFFKIEKPDTLYRGVGLGLSISKNLVELMGGKIWYESQVNMGTSFYFTLPLVNTMYPGINQMNEHPTQEYMDNWETKTVLVAEDEESNFILIKEILAPTKINVIHAKNGQEAIDQYKNNHVDLVLMDIKMPIIDGFKASETIKTINPSQCIIAQTAFALKNEREKVLQSEIDDYIAKPIIPNDLLSLVRKYL